MTRFLLGLLSTAIIVSVLITDGIPLGTTIVIGVLWGGSLALDAQYSHIKRKLNDNHPS